MFSFSDLEALFRVNEGFFQNLVEIRNLQLVILNKPGLLQILHTSPARYVASHEYYERNCTNMLEFLAWYNILDCKLLADAIERYADGFLTDWKTNIHQFMSVSLNL